MNLAQLKAQGVAYIDLLNNTLVYKNGYADLIQMVIARRNITSAQASREMNLPETTVYGWLTHYRNPRENFVPIIKQWLSENGVTL